MKAAAAIRASALLLAAAAALVLAVSGPGTRLGLWPWTTGLALLRWALYLGAAATVISIAALAVPSWRAGRPAVLVAALLLAVGAAAAPLRFVQLARAVPPIHDITTDAQDPPQLAALLPLRAGAANPPEYAGPAVFEQQRGAYPDIGPLLLPVSAALAFSRAERAARSLGWEIVAADAAAGRIEAVATTAWFGFRDDVVVRVRGDATQSRVDVRSKSRVGRSDVGANAARIRAFLSEMRSS